MAKPAFDRQEPTAPRPLEYNQLAWGDLIYGTKDQIRSLGVAVAASFPGEDGCGKRRLTVTDPRGLKCLIEKCHSREAGIFCAAIHLPGREPPEQPFEDYAPGVRRQENTWSDDYLGTADALAAARLLHLEQLPGQPGMRKHVVTILPDGSLAQGAPNVRHFLATAAGARRITRASGASFQVSIFVADDEKSRRYAAYARSRREWETQMRRLPRPPPLHARLVIFASTEKAAATAEYRTVGNVTYLPGL